MRIEKRLQRLEHFSKDGMSDLVKGTIGRFYDELSDSEKEAWLKYRYSTDLQTFETVEQTICGVYGNPVDWHFICDRRPPPPTPAELEKARREIANYLEEKCNHE